MNIIILKHLSRNEDKIGFPNDFFKSFLKNEEFRNRFVLMFCDYANDLFNIDRIKTIINDYTENYLDELSECIVRWRNYDNGTKEEAFVKSNRIQSFARDSLKRSAERISSIRVISPQPFSSKFE